MSHIAVFGGSGAVGKYVVEGLEYFGHDVTIIGRKQRPDVLNYQAVDINNAQDLEQACIKFDSIVNAAGPANVILDTIARVALSHGIPYVDVSGEPELYESLTKTPVIPSSEHTSPCVIGAGFVPGFASLLAGIADTQLDSIEEFTAYVGGVEAFTRTSALDFIASIGVNDALTGCGISKGEVTRVMPHNLQPAEHSPVFLALPYLSAEHQRIAAETGIPEYQAFNLIADQSMFSLGKVEREKAVSMLIAESESLTSTYGTQQFCIVEAEGTLDGEKATFKLHSCTADGYRLTGWMSALAAHQATGGSGKNGVQWLSDMVDYRHLLESIEQAKLFDEWRVSFEISSDDDMEEGEL